jgi:hypothetical protein
VFLTFQFEPGFFEQEVLPVFFDIGLSHAPPVRILQLDDALRALPGEIAVYYDANGLVTGKTSPKLDVRRIPVRHRTGIFHAKNVLLLVEPREVDEEGLPSVSLLVAGMSANLTQAGWWENVESCHVEEIAAGDKTRLKDDLSAFLRRLRKDVSAVAEHAALDEILRFLGSTEQRRVRSIAGQPQPHFYSGRRPLIEFLQEAAGNQLTGTYLEIISPYFDNAPQCTPLKELLDALRPRKTVVYLPYDERGVALCNEKLYQAVRALPEVSWGTFPRDFTRMGRGENAGERFVHAKVYRFFTANPKREILFVGSANLTNAAHGSGGNLETGFLIAREPTRRPEFWLTPEDRQPQRFEVRTEDADAVTSRGSRLQLHFRWSDKSATAYWDHSEPTQTLRLEMQSEDLGELPALKPRRWTPLSASFAEKLERLLKQTAWVTVHGDLADPVVLLIQEDGMSHKPSLLLEMSPADILKYWSLLTPEQRTAFVEGWAGKLLTTDEGAELVTRARAVDRVETLFDRFAGIFHAFNCLEEAVLEAVDIGNEKEATYRLFGNKYDSLGNLLQQLGSDVYAGDDGDRYVILLCARQLCDEVARRHRDYWNEHRDDVRRLEERLAKISEIRQRLTQTDPALMEAYLNWFEPRFLRRSRPAEEANS